MSFELANKPRALPTVLSSAETTIIIEQLEGAHQLICYCENDKISNLGGVIWGGLINPSLQLRT